MKSGESAKTNRNRLSRQWMNHSLLSTMQSIVDRLGIGCPGGMDEWIIMIGGWASSIQPRFCAENDGNHWAMRCAVKHESHMTACIPFATDFPPRWRLLCVERIVLFNYTVLFVVLLRRRRRRVINEWKWKIPFIPPYVLRARQQIKLNAKNDKILYALRRILDSSFVVAVRDVAMTTSDSRQQQPLRQMLTAERTANILSIVFIWAGCNVRARAPGQAKTMNDEVNVCARQDFLIRFYCSYKFNAICNNVRPSPASPANVCVCARAFESYLVVSNEQPQWCTIAPS